MKKDAELRQGSKSSVSIPAYKTLENPPVCVCADKFETAPFEVMLKVCAFLIFHPTKKLPPGRCESTRAGIKKTQNKTKQKKTEFTDVLSRRLGWEGAASLAATTATTEIEPLHQAWEDHPDAVFSELLLFSSFICLCTSAPCFSRSSL